MSSNPEHPSPIYREKEITDYADTTRFVEGDNGEIWDKKTSDYVGCEICHTHSCAYGVIPESNEIVAINAPLCPQCGEPLEIKEDSAVIGEANFYQPDAKMFKAPVFHCDACEAYYALALEPISYNGNHDIYYTGGSHYLESGEDEELIRTIGDSMKDSLKQYLDRKILEHDNSIRDWNIHLWCTRDAEAAIAKWLYDRGLKR